MSYSECLYSECCYSECHNSECHNSECHNSECHNSECHNSECHNSECRGMILSCIKVLAVKGIFMPVVILQSQRTLTEGERSIQLTSSLG